MQAHCRHSIDRGQGSDLLLRQDLAPLQGQVPVQG